MRSPSRFLSKSSLILFILALVVRILTAWPQQQPNYMDAAYSYVNALNLATGRGFVEDFVWNYLGQPEPPPHPSHLYWMPLTSILAWLGMMIGGISYRAAQIPFIILSAFLAPVAYWIAGAISERRKDRWLAGLLMIFSGFYFWAWTAIDNFTPFALFGALSLFLAWRAVAQKESQQKLNLFGAGLCVGLAHLARADGPLLLISIILILSLYFWRTQSVSLKYLIPITSYLVIGYLVMMLPWFIRNWQVVGTPLPTDGSQTIWLPTGTNLFDSYNNLYSYQQALTLQTFFAQGVGPIVQGRWWVFGANIQTVIATWGMIFLTPLALIGGWLKRDQLLVQLAGGYALLLFVALTFVFAFPGALGGLFHSGAALFPFIAAIAPVGLDGLIDWIAARRRHWDAELAKQFFGVGLVLMAVLLSSFIYYQRVLKNNAWNRADALYPTLAEWVQAENPTATVMINNPPAYRYHGGGLSVVIPNEDISTMLQLARHYHVDYLILERNHPAPLIELYQQPDQHPDLTRIKTFAEGTEHEVYLFELN